MSDLFFFFPISRSRITFRTLDVVGADHVYINFQVRGVSQVATIEPGAGFHIQLWTQLHSLCDWIYSGGAGWHSQRLPLQ